MALAAASSSSLRDHRLLRRYTYTSMAVGLVLLLLPLLPGIGTTINGSRIWIRVGPLSFQPGEFAKIALTIFFAGYLVADPRRPLARRPEGPRLHLPARPRPRPDPRRLAGQPGRPHLREGPRLRRCCSSALFVAMLYVATERVSWIAIGLVLFAAGAYLGIPDLRPRPAAGRAVARPLLARPSLEQSDQLAKGIMGHGLRRALRHRAGARAGRGSSPSPTATSSSPASARSSASSGSSRSCCSTRSSSSAASAPRSACATASASCSPSAWPSRSRFQVSSSSAASPGSSR